MIERIKNNIAYRKRAILFLFSGHISLRQCFIQMVPRVWRPKKKETLRLFHNPITVPGKDFGDLIALIDEILNRNQYHIELIKGGGVVVDAGANIGIFSIVAAKNYPDIVVYAFEPTPSIFELLKENTKYYSNIKIFNCALGEMDGFGFIKDLGHGGGRNYISHEGIKCEIKTIDSYNLPMIFLKIDTEGYEENILKGAINTIKQNKPVIVMSAYHKADDKIRLPQTLNIIRPYDCELRHDGEEDFICKPI